MPFTRAVGPRSGLDGVGRAWWSAVTRTAERIRRTAEPALLDTVVTSAATLLGAPVGLALLEGDDLVRRAASGTDTFPLGTVVDTVGTFCGEVVGRGRAVRSGDAVAVAGTGPSGSCCPGFRSTLSVPLVASGRVLGVLTAGGDQADRFGEVDEHALFVLADAAAAALAEHVGLAGHPTSAEYPGSAEHDAHPVGGPDPGAHVSDAPADDPAGPVGGRVPAQARSAPPGSPEEEPTSAATRPAAPARPAAPTRPTLPAPAPAPGPGILPSAHVPLDPGPRPRQASEPEPGLRRVGLWQWDAATGEVTCSPQVGAALGTPVGHRIGLDVVRDLLHPDDLTRFDETLLAHVGRRRPVEGQFRVVVSDGRVRHLHVWSDLRVEGGRIVAAFGGVADVTARQGELTALRAGRFALSAARELTGMAFWEFVPATGELTWSPEMFRLAGLPPSAPTPGLARWHQLVHPDDLEHARRLDVEAFERCDGGTETFRVLGADGVQRHVLGWSAPVVLGDGSRLVQGAAVDLTAQVQDRMRLDRLSATDPVTGLANRVAFERRFTQLLADPSRDITLILLDLDRFKLVNDSLGHQVGDRILVEVARRLAAVVPGGSLTARMGGDEFVVVPRPAIGWLQVRRLAQQIVETLRQPYVLPETGETLVCPVSVGVTGTSGREVGAEELLSEADLALYRAKDSGRDRYVVYDDALRSRARDRHLAEQLLRSALERGWLTLRYQPIADLRTGQVVGAEALVRIDEPGGGLVRPDVFIEVAEDTGLVVDLDCWVIETALTQLTTWAARRRRSELPWLAINVSARSMEQPRVVQRLLDGLRRRRLPTRAVKIELTEHSFLGAAPAGESALRELIGSGVPVGIDDFGTGYSALAYLQRFELDFMKIDRSFVATVGEQPRADAVVTAIVGLAHAHGMQVTAEGIEKPVQALRLAEIGCDFAQGYHVGRPVEPGLLLG